LWSILFLDGSALAVQKEGSMLEIVLSSPATYLVLAGQVFLIVFSAWAVGDRPSGSPPEWNPAVAGQWLKNLSADAPEGPTHEWRRKWGKALLPSATRARLG
jgi:hypothetical protein